MDITEKISDLEKANKKMSALGVSEVFRLNEKLNLRLLPISIQMFLRIVPLQVAEGYGCCQCAVSRRVQEKPA